MPKATTQDGVDLFYELRGNPDATQQVVFVMGMGGSHKGWDLQSQYFVGLPDYQVLVFDNRGAGFSASPTTPYTVENMASDVIFLATEVASFQHFHLVGVSLGGMIAQHVGLMIPEKIISLTLMVTRIVGGFWNHLPSLKGLVQFYRMHQVADNPEALINAGADLLFPYEYLEASAGDGKTNRDALRELVKQRNKEVPTQNADGRKHQLAAARGHHIYPHQMAELKSAKFHVLAIVGDQDTLIRPAHSYSMPDQIGADLLVVEGAGHGVMQQCPELVNYYLQEHFRASSISTRNTFPKTTRLHYTYKPAASITPPVAQQVVGHSAIKL